MFRVGAAYFVVGWLLIEVADTVFPRLGLPEWTVTFVIALLLLGLPVALFLAWAFELTPEGVKRTDDVQLDESVRKLTGRTRLQVVQFEDRIELIPLRSAKSLRGSLPGLDTQVPRDADRM